MAHVIPLEHYPSSPPVVYQTQLSSYPNAAGEFPTRTDVVVPSLSFAQKMGHKLDKLLHVQTWHAPPRTRIVPITDPTYPVLVEKAGLSSVISQTPSIAPPKGISNLNEEDLAELAELKARIKALNDKQEKNPSISGSKWEGQHLRDDIRLLRSLNNYAESDRSHISHLSGLTLLRSRLDVGSNGYLSDIPKSDLYISGSITSSKKISGLASPLSHNASQRDKAAYLSESEKPRASDALYFAPNMSNVGSQHGSPIIESLYTSRQPRSRSQGRSPSGSHYSSLGSRMGDIESDYLYIPGSSKGQMVPPVQSTQCRQCESAPTSCPDRICQSCQNSSQKKSSSHPAPSPHVHFPCSSRRRTRTISQPSTRNQGLDSLRSRLTSPSRQPNINFAATANLRKLENHLEKNVEEQMRELQRLRTKVKLIRMKEQHNAGYRLPTPLPSTSHTKFADIVRKPHSLTAENLARLPLHDVMETVAHNGVHSQLPQPQDASTTHHLSSNVTLKSLRKSERAKSIQTQSTKSNFPPHSDNEQEFTSIRRRPRSGQIYDLGEDATYGNPLPRLYTGHPLIRHPIKRKSLHLEGRPSKHDTV